MAEAYRPVAELLLGNPRRVQRARRRLVRQFLLGAPLTDAEKAKAIAIIREDQGPDTGTP